MLFRNNNGTIKEVNLLDYNNDSQYYKTILNMKKEMMKSEKEGNKTLTSFLQKSSKVSTS